MCGEMRGVWQTPPMEMATEAGGTHATGMHSCFIIFNMVFHTIECVFISCVQVLTFSIYVIFTLCFNPKVNLLDTTIT